MKRVKVNQDEFQNEFNTLQKTHRESLNSMRRHHELEIETMKSQLKTFLTSQREDWKKNLERIKSDQNAPDISEEPVVNHRESEHDLWSGGAHAVGGDGCQVLQVSGVSSLK